MLRLIKPHPPAHTAELELQAGEWPCLEVRQARPPPQDMEESQGSHARQAQHAALYDCQVLLSNQSSQLHRQAIQKGCDRHIN